MSRREPIVFHYLHQDTIYDVMETIVARRFQDELALEEIDLVFGEEGQESAIRYHQGKPLALAEGSHSFAVAVIEDDDGHEDKVYALEKRADGYVGRIYQQGSIRTPPVFGRNLFQDPVGMTMRRQESGETEIVVIDRKAGLLFFDLNGQFVRDTPIEGIRKADFIDESHLLVMIEGEDEKISFLIVNAETGETDAVKTELFEGVLASEEEALDLSQIELLRDIDEAAINNIRTCVKEITVPAGGKIFGSGDEGDEVFLIRRGVVRILLPLPGGKRHHLATFGQGDFFGEMSFLDKGKRSAEAVARTNCDLYVISREEFNTHVYQDAVIGVRVFARVARAISLRLRQTDTELRAIEDR